MRYGVAIIVVSIFLLSCGMEKRLYRPGYYFHFVSHDHNKTAASSLKENEVETDSAKTAPSIPEIASLTEEHQAETRAEKPEKSLASCVLHLTSLHDSASVANKNNDHLNLTSAKTKNENFSHGVALLFIILIEIAGIALLSWAVTLVFPSIPIWLAIVIGLLAFYLLLIILYLIFARNEA